MNRNTQSVVGYKSVKVAEFELSARAMYAVGGGGPYNEVVLLTDTDSRSFLIGRRELDALHAEVVAKFTHGDSEEDSARVYMHALHYMVVAADDRVKK